MAYHIIRLACHAAAAAGGMRATALPLRAAILHGDAAAIGCWLLRCADEGMLLAHYVGFKMLSLAIKR